VTGRTDRICCDRFVDSLLSPGLQLGGDGVEQALLLDVAVVRHVLGGVGQGQRFDHHKVGGRETQQ
jgi:hypothetical protein